jgi:DNA transposition AAA+ family ATPase
MSDSTTQAESTNVIPLAARPLGAEPFIETPTSEKIASALSYAQVYGDMVCIYGGAGVGKTRTIAHVARTYRNVFVASMTPASAGLVSALEVVAEAVGAPEVGGGARRLSRAIRAQLMVAPQALLIIDEAQHLSLSAIEELRSIHDATDCGLALVGNETVYTRLTGGSRAAHFAQIFSRIGMRLFVAAPQPGDVRALAASWGVKNADAVALLEQVAARPGALRGVHKAIRSASRSKREVTVEALQRALATLGAEV